ncbi:MAG: DUF4153 domain-containing protein [Mucilaginibacter sp.]|uniref:DUF4153 domain-containing protein n=1 Tax=Mucilaginibacter sp. TaxID=1882438 RepID=UPI00326385E2
MKLPSIKLLAQNTFSVFKRFPLEVISVVFGSTIATINIKSSYHNYEFDGTLYTRLTMLASLSLLLNLSATLFTASKQIKGIAKWGYHIVACIVIAGLFFMLNPYNHGTAYLIRFFLISLSFHLLVAIAAFIGVPHVNGFWQFNKTLFLRFLASFLYGVVLYLGLAGALASMNFLFNTHFEWDTFSILWVWVVGVFTSVFFLAGVPNDLNALEHDENYPKGLKVFTQYVLIPLATVYVIILLSYEGKILIEWRLPKGMVSDLILGYAVFGILSLLLVYPIRNLEENKWLKTFARSFYFLMIPLIVLLFLAVGTRVFKYGITEYRYFLILLSCWLFFITLYFLISKKQNIKLIPTSLCILTLLSVYGPQSAFSVSEFSQRRVLQNIFEKYGAVNDGKLISLADKKVSNKDGRRAVSTLEYLIDSHNLTSLQTFFKRDLTEVIDSISKLKNKAGKIIVVDRYDLHNKKLEWAKAYLGLSKFNWNRYSRDTDTDVVEIKTKNLRAKADGVIEIKGFDYIINGQYLEDDTTLHHYTGIAFKQRHDKNKNTYNLTLNNERIVFEIAPLVNKLLKDKNLKNYKDKNEYQDEYTFPKDMLELRAESKSYLIIFKIDNITVDAPKIGNQDLNSVRGDFYIKIKH